MTARKHFGAFLLGGCALLPAQRGPAQQQHVLVRLAELQIDPARMTEYQALLREEIEASVRIEPGVLALYAVAVEGHPGEVRLFEMYRDRAAYDAHLKSPHFLKYKAQTQTMVQRLTLLEADPIVLGSKLR